MFLVNAHGRVLLNLIEMLLKAKTCEDVLMIDRWWLNKEVNLSVFVYRLFHEDISPIFRTSSDLNLFRRLERNLHETVCKQIQIT